LRTISMHFKIYFYMVGRFTATLSIPPQVAVNKQWRYIGDCLFTVLSMWLLSSKTSYVYSGGTPFESPPTHRWPEGFCGFPQSLLKYDIFLSALIRPWFLTSDIFPVHLRVFYRVTCGLIYGERSKIRNMFISFNDSVCVCVRACVMTVDSESLILLLYPFISCEFVNVPRIVGMWLLRLFNIVEHFIVRSLLFSLLEGTTFTGEASCVNVPNHRIWKIYKFLGNLGSCLPNDTA
jgi:hypothetical protein